MSLHPLVEAAALGRIPSWAEATAQRREHMSRVAGLLEDWARAWGLSEPERTRWMALGFLHDALRDAEPESLRPMVPPLQRTLPGKLLHGPAAAERLRVAGVRDGAFLRAVADHTLGHPAFRRMGMALYAADFLDPGRDLRNEWRAGLRRRMPEELRGVVREICAARVAHLVECGRRVHPQTVSFWNSLSVEG